MALVLQLAIGVAVATAHQWDSYHWNKGGSKVNMYFHDETGGCGKAGTPTNDALYDIYYNPHPIWIFCTSSHTEISIFQAYQPGAGYCGLATIWPNSKKHITHGHAMWNTACTSGAGLSGKLYRQGVFCQEIAHTLGLDHSATGDCMGLSYYSSSNGRYYFDSTGPYIYDWGHQTSDLYWMYRYHSPH